MFIVIYLNSFTIIDCINLINGFNTFIPLMMSTYNIS